MRLWHESEPQVIPDSVWYFLAPSGSAAFLKWIHSDKRPKYWIVKDTLPPAPFGFFPAESLYLTLMTLLDVPLHLDAVERLRHLHCSMTSRGE